MSRIFELLWAGQVESIGSLSAGQGTLLSALLDQSHECIKLLDAAGRILFVNREGCKAMELSAPGDIIGQFWVERWPDQSRAVVEQALRAVTNGDVARFSASRLGPSGQSCWWDVTLTPIARTPIARDGEARILTIARDVTAEVTERERVAAINAEMRHRLRNAMTIAAGIVTLEARSAPMHQPFASSVCERFAQLAHVQDLVLDPAREKSLVQILPLLAAVYGKGELLEIGTMPDVRLNDTATQALALAFGELATNSLKYGALSAARVIEIEGMVQEGLLHLVWREPTDFSGPRDGGQGLGLMDRLLIAAGGRLTRDVGPGLLTVRVSIPVAP